MTDTQRPRGGWERGGRGPEEADPIGCREAARRVYEYLDGELDPEWTERVRRHLEVCLRCYPYFDFERIFLDRIRSRGLGADRTRELEEEILALLRETE